ncbi:low temperature requirement protein A [Micromonospora purpureochromogenes]|uniref:Low temperature requirement protein LtrA n=1 Tax=Micromonospora purpureochromogenes TaxID=47872 RepID=A0ABX2RTX4_9ACTN|nr:low temperature requirement protein A [Micromonospora purpureochromogenes]NYF59990.1 low temperature requirement protein LtrA [Micromonospora purpureochromogenes]
MELFLDLVFVYAFLSVTDLMAENFRTEGLFQGVLVVLLLWRCWSLYTLLGNVVRLDRGFMRPLIFGVAATILLIGIATPVIFTDRPGGLFGPMIFVVAFLLAQSSALLILTYTVSDRTRRPLLRAWLPFSGGAILLLSGALLPRHLPSDVDKGSVQLALFFAATAVDFIGVRALGTGTWRIVSVPHWAERHRLVMLIALGETIISIGTSRGLIGDPPITWSVIAGSALSLVVVAVLWWRYFDIAGFAAEQALEQRPAATRSRLGRDAHSVLHVVMIVGLVLIALGLKRALSSVEPDTAYRWDLLSTLVLYGGVLVYLLGQVALERRTIRLLGRSPLLGIVLVTALVPIAVRLPAVGAVGLLAAILTSMVLADLTVFRRRHHVLHRQAAQAAVRAATSGVTPKELFLDLVVVYTFIQVTVLMTRHPTGVGVVQALAVLSVLWVAWSLYTQVGNALRSESIPVRLSVLLVVALTLTIGIAIPQAFDVVPDGLPGPLIVVICYIALRMLHLTALLVLSRDRIPRAQLLRAGVPNVAALVLLVFAALASSRPHAPAGLSQLVAGLWLAAIVVDLAGGYLVVRRFWPVTSAKHWTDRYALIILIALGEAVISAGVAVFGRPISWSVIVAVATSMALLATLWWAYFDTDAIVAERVMQDRAGNQRVVLARDAYTYLHLPMIIGLMLLAFGLRRTLDVVSDPSGPARDPLGYALLFAGVVVYLLANQAFWWRIQHEIRWVRATGILLVAILAPATNRLPPLWALTILTAVTAAVIMIDSRRAAELRRRLHEPPPSTILTDARPVNPVR